MYGNQTEDSESGESKHAFEPNHTEVLNLSNYKGAEYKGACYLTLDEDRVYDGIEDEKVEAINDGIHGINHVLHNPQNILWIRNAQRDLIFTYQYMENVRAEDSGYLRVLSCTITIDEDGPSIHSEHHCGLINPFKAVNAIVDIIGAIDSSNMLLCDIEMANCILDHPIFTLDQNSDQHMHLVNWGRIKTRTPPTRLTNSEHATVALYDEDDPFGSVEEFLNKQCHPVVSL